MKTRELLGRLLCWLGLHSWPAWTHRTYSVERQCRRCGKWSWENLIC